MGIISLKSDDDAKTSAPVSPESAHITSKNQITDLKFCVHDQNRVNIYIDGEFCFSLDIAQVVEHHLKIGKVVTPEEISALKHASTFGKLYTQTLEWVLIRPRSIKETRDHLMQRLAKLEIDNKRRKENHERIKTDPEFKKLAREHKIKIAVREVFTKDDIEKVIKQLSDKGYLDDRKFAGWYIENRFINKGVSLARLRQELFKKGITTDIIDELLANSPRNESQEIEKVIQKKKNKLDAQKMLNYLIRHGFSIDLSRELVAKHYEGLVESPELFV